MMTAHALPSRRKAPTAFTLVELLVVIGIIALLVSMLLPALNRARAAAQSVKCGSNLRQMGIAMFNYATTFKGAILPHTPWLAEAPNTYDRQAFGFLYWNGWIPADITRCPSDPLPPRAFYIFGPNPPGSTDGGKCGYMYNYFGLGPNYGIQLTENMPGAPAGSFFHGWRQTDIKFPSETYWICDNKDISDTGADGQDDIMIGTKYSDGTYPRRHSGGVNMLWLDGHVTLLPGKTYVMHGWARWAYGWAAEEAWFDAPR
jgi:prepilin-type processing-associated H-X9-DG protein